jgi:Metallo-peptidase family M12B Reprolysin-like
VRRALLALFVAAACFQAAPASAHGGPWPVVGTHGPDARPAHRFATAGAASAPAPWCGDERSTDIPGATDGLAHVHAVYALPADAPSRLQALAPGVQADAEAASAILEQRSGRAIRFDRGSACGTRNLDITTVRLPQSTAALQRLAAEPDGTMDAIARGLRRAGFDTAVLGEPARARAKRRADFVVWLDGPYPEGSCGQAQLTVDRRRSADNVNNGGGKVAAIFRDGAGFCGPATVLHEIGHMIGAVQPKPGQGGWTGHCHDAAEDVMCDAAAPGAGGPRTLVDPGNDDYWDPPAGAPLPFWTMNLSRFLCAGTDCTAAPEPAAARRSRRPFKR